MEKKEFENLAKILENFKNNLKENWKFVHIDDMNIQSNGENYDTCLKLNIRLLYS